MWVVSPAGRSLTEGFRAMNGSALLARAVAAITRGQSAPSVTVAKIVP
jgi:hypothetical protein